MKKIIVLVVVSLLYASHSMAMDGAEQERQLLARNPRLAVLYATRQNATAVMLGSGNLLSSDPIVYERERAFRIANDEYSRAYAKELEKQFRIR